MRICANLANITLQKTAKKVLTRGAKKKAASEAESSGSNTTATTTAAKSKVCCVVCANPCDSCVLTANLYRLKINSLQMMKCTKVMKKKSLKSNLPPL